MDATIDGVGLLVGEAAGALLRRCRILRIPAVQMHPCPRSGGVAQELGYFVWSGLLVGYLAYLVFYTIFGPTKGVCE